MNLSADKNVTSIYSSTSRANANDIFFKPENERRRAPRNAKIGRVNRKYFEELRAEHGLSLRALAKLMGMTHSQLSAIFNGDRKMQLNEAAQLSQVFGQPIYSIIENAGVFVQPVGARRAKVVGAVLGDGSVEALPDSAGYRTAAPDHLPSRAVAIQMRTAGTEIGWMDGAILFCAEPSGIDVSALLRLCLVQISGGPLVLGVVGRGYTPGTYSLTGPHRQQDVKIEWASPILFTKH